MPLTRRRQRVRIFRAERVTVLAELTGQILNAVQEQSRDGRITCVAARKLAEELKVPYKVIGKAADELKIKIKSCELGCF